MLTIAALGVGVLAFPFSIWPFAFSLGALLATANLWWMAKSVTWSVSQRFSPTLVLVYFGGFLLRFTGTGVLLYILLIRCSLPLVPLIAGLSSVVLCLMMTAFFRNAGNSCKEA